MFPCSYFGKGVGSRSAGSTQQHRSRETQDRPSSHWKPMLGRGSCWSIFSPPRPVLIGISSGSLPPQRQTRSGAEASFPWQARRMRTPTSYVRGGACQDRPADSPQPRGTPTFPCDGCVRHASTPALPWERRASQLSEAPGVCRRSQLGRRCEVRARIDAEGLNRAQQRMAIGGYTENGDRGVARRGRESGSKVARKIAPRLARKCEIGCHRRRVLHRSPRRGSRAVSGGLSKLKSSLRSRSARRRTRSRAAPSLRTSTRDPAMELHHGGADPRRAP